MRQFEKFCDRAEKVCSLAVILIFATITVVYFGSVATRYLFGTGFRGSEELTRYGTIWLIYLSAVIMTRHGEHINVSVLENLLKGKARLALLLVQRLLLVVYIAIMFVISLQMVKVGARQTSPNMNIPMNMVYLVFPVAFLFIALQAALPVARQVVGLIKPGDGEDLPC